MMRSVVAWHVYSLSHSAFHLGLIGIVQFVPALALTLVGGAVADSFDRRRVINVAQLVAGGVGSALYLITARGAIGLPTLYACVLLIAIAMTFEGPARSALLPQIVGAARFQH